MGIILETINKNCKLSKKEAATLDEALKQALVELMDKSLTHGYYSRKEDAKEALKLTGRTFRTNL